MSASEPSGRPNWPKDEFGRSEVIFQMWWVSLLAFGVLAALVIGLVAFFRNNKPKEVVVYCAQDQLYAEPIFKRFEQASGIRVRAVYDNEAVKTVGLANRLLAERNYPQADLFWGNEEMRTRQLAAQNVFRETNGWAAFGYRSRRLVVNTNLLALAAAPRSLLELTNRIFYRKIALAYPQFGTTATYFNTLRQHWTEERWQDWCRSLAANQPLLVDGNSVVVKVVAQGQASLGLTDSDDIAQGQQEGWPVTPLPINHETLLIPNSVAVIRHAPHPAPAQMLFQYLQRPEIVKQLVAAHALEGVTISQVSQPTLKPDWRALLANLNRTTGQLNEIFLR